MQKALIAGIAISLSCSLLGLFLVIKRYSLYGDAISHVALSGIAIGIFLNVYPLWTAFITSILTSLGITKLKKSVKLHGEMVITLILISGISIAVLLLSLSRRFTLDLLSYLFGSIFLISNEDLITSLIASSIVIFSLLFIKDRLFYISLDEEQAKISGVNTDLIDYIFIILASVTIIISIRLVGVLLVSSLIVLPNISSIMLGKGFRCTIGYSLLFSSISVIIGLILSYYLDIAPSAMITIVGISIMLIIIISKRFTS